MKLYAPTDSIVLNIWSSSVRFYYIFLQISQDTSFAYKHFDHMFKRLQDWIQYMTLLLFFTYKNIIHIRVYPKVIQKASEVEVLKLIIFMICKKLYLTDSK